MIFALVICIFILFIYIFMQLPRFGRGARGERRNRIGASPHFKDGQFQNLSVTPSLAEGATFFGVLRKFLFQKSKRTAPAKELPSVRVDLHTIDPAKNIIVWFGHSSYYMQLDGRRILVDPVFSGSASPLRFTTKSFKGSDVYASSDIPNLDYVFISHDHWDHLDFSTLTELKGRVKRIITGLGVGAHFERWGFETALITELDWNEKFSPEPGFDIQSVPARHFSGRGFRRNRTLWSSFAFRTPSKNIFIGGDSGYDAHFAEAGRALGPFDLAILENGQYNEDWKYIHMLPEEVVKAATDLRAQIFLPVHWGKFSLSLHAWDEPIIRVVKEAGLKNVPVLHPMIGQVVDLDAPMAFKSWWTEVE